MLLKILMIGNVPLDPLLGSGKTRLMWAQGLREAGHHVSVWEPKDFELKYGRNWPAKKFRQTIGAWLKIRAEWFNRCYDVVILYGDEFWSISSWLLCQKRPPLIVSGSDGVEIFMIERLWAFEGAPKSFKNRIRRVWDWMFHYHLAQKAFRQTDGLICGSRGDVLECIKRGYYLQDWTSVIPPGLDPIFLEARVELPRNHSIAFNGSWIPRKGIDAFVRITQKLMRSYRELRIEIYGTGSSDDAVRNLYEEDLRSRVTVHPRHSAVTLREGLERVKVFFLPTQYEGFGMATSEAMSCGCAVVTTPTGFGTEMLSGEEALIHDFNDESGMENSISMLLKESELRERIAANGRRRAQSLCWSDSQRRLSLVIQDWVTWRRTNS